MKETTPDKSSAPKTHDFHEPRTALDTLVDQWLWETGPNPKENKPNLIFP